MIVEFSAVHRDFSFPFRLSANAIPAEAAAAFVAAPVPASGLFLFSLASFVIGYGQRGLDLLVTGVRELVSPFSAAGLSIRSFIAKVE